MALTFDDEKMEIYPTLQDLEAAVFQILNVITNTLQVRFNSHLMDNDNFIALFSCKNVFWAGFDIFDVNPQKVQTVQSWLAQAPSSFVDAKVADHILAWAQVTLKTSVCKNLEEADKHFQNYGDGP